MIVLDLSQLRGYGLPDEATALLTVLSLWKVRKFLDSTMRLRSACELEIDAKAGGLQDLRSDPEGVFLFRFEPPRIVKRLGRPQLNSGPDSGSPVVYRLDLRDARSYFLAQRFPIEDKDIIYVANAELNELQKFFSLLNTLTGPVITGIVVKGSVP